MNRIICRNVNNMRDIGGLTTKSGEFIKPFRFIRSNYPSALTPEETAFLLGKDITTMIDLRKPEELVRNKNAFDRSPFRFYNVPLKGDGWPEHEADIPGGYIVILEDRLTIKSVLSIMAEAPGGILFNCQAGKDRTGVIAMLLLLIAHAYEDDIIADYQISHTFLRLEVREMHRKWPDLPPFLGQSKAEYMERTLNLFRNRFGKIETYLDYIDLSDVDRKSIRDKLFRE